MEYEIRPEPTAHERRALLEALRRLRARSRVRSPARGWGIEEEEAELRTFHRAPGMPREPSE